MDIHETQDYYAAIAPVYDEIAGYFETESEKLRGPFKMNYRSLFKTRRVLEIACGTGYWTEVIGQAAALVLATDVNESMLVEAKRRCHYLSNVKFRVANAYSLDNVSGEFDAAFANGWWSHIPKDMVSIFLTALHSKLKNDSLVIFVDQLPSEPGFCALNTTAVRVVGGNRLELRSVPDGSVYEIIKNLPTQQELWRYLAGISRDFSYEKGQGMWKVTYRVVKPEAPNLSVT